MKLLLLITNKYPFGKEETFVHNELPFTSEGIDQVFILPVCGHCGEEHRLLSSTNIRVFPGECRQHKHLRLYNILPLRPLKEALNQLCKSHFFSRLSYISSYEEMIQQTRLVQRRIVEEVKLINPKEVIIYSYWCHFHAVIALELQRQIKRFCPTYAISRAHGFDLYEERNDIQYLPYRYLLFANLIRIYCCSRQGTEYLQKKYPQYKDKFITEYLGVPDYWSGIIPSRKMPFHVVTCSRSVPVKRLELWIRALATIQVIPIKWTHLGDGEEQAKLKALAYDILPSNIEAVFRGELANHEISELYNTGCVNLIVNTSSSEGLPVSLMEAFACAIPAVASNVGGVSEIVDDGKNGFLFSADSSLEEIASKVRQFIAMDELEYMDFCRAARRKYEQCFNDEVNYRQFYEVISSLSNEWK